MCGFRYIDPEWSSWGGNAVLGKDNQWHLFMAEIGPSGMRECVSVLEYSIYKCTPFFRTSAPLSSVRAHPFLPYDGPHSILFWNKPTKNVHLSTSLLTIQVMSTCVMGWVSIPMTHALPPAHLFWVLLSLQVEKGWVAGNHTLKSRTLFRQILTVHTHGRALLRRQSTTTLR